MHLSAERAGNVLAGSSMANMTGDTQNQPTMASNSLDIKTSARPRRSPEHQLETSAGKVESSSLSRTTNPSSASSTTLAGSTQHTPPPANRETQQSLLWALERSSTSDGVAALLISAFQDRKESQNREQSLRRTKLFMKSSVNPFHSPAAYKAQLKAKFHDAYYPETLSTAFCPTRFLLFNIKSTANIQLAEQALYLAQLGTISGDDRAVKEALRVYQASVIQLRCGISKPDAALDDQTFVVAHLLCLFEMYTNVSTDHAGPKRHLEGIGQLLVAKGPQSVKSFPLQISLQIYQQFQLINALVLRKRGKTCSRQWLRILANNEKCKWRLPQMTSFVLQLPGILERVEKILSQGKKATEEDILNILSAVKTFERDLREWMSEWYIENPEVPYWKIQTERCPWLNALINDEHSSIFTSLFEFPGTAAAKAHQNFWTALMASAEASKDLSALLIYPLPPSQTLEEQHGRFVDEINESADSLCMCAMYMCRPENGVDSWIDACHCLQFASIWYEKNGSLDKVAWCREVVKGIERRGIRAPSFSRPPRRRE